MNFDFQAEVMRRFDKLDDKIDDLKDDHAALNTRVTVAEHKQGAISTIFGLVGGALSGIGFHFLRKP